MSTVPEPDVDSKMSELRPTYTDAGSTLDIRIIDTEEVKSTLFKHTAYIIEHSTQNNITISRRYNDFKWLHNVLSIQFLCMFIPPLPRTNTSGDVLHKFDPDFVSQRRNDLQRFLNRISSHKLWSTSEPFEVFMSQISRNRFEEQQKNIRDKLLARNETEIAEFIGSKCYPHIQFSAHGYANLSDVSDGDTPATEESDEEHAMYMESVPRVREVYMRCEERLARINALARNIFQIQTHMVDEIGTFNECLYALHDIENKERPPCLNVATTEPEPATRADVCGFINAWRRVQQNSMLCWFKYWLTTMRYEHEDCQAVLDIFVRYDIVYNKYKKLLAQFHKDEKQHAQQREIDEENYAYEQQNEQKRKLINVKHLLDMFCKVILEEQVPDLWLQKMKTFNLQVEQFRQQYTTQCALH